MVSVYIEEAHAEEEWPISSSRFNGGRGVVRVRQPRTDTERIEVSKRFVADFGFETPMLVDSVANRLQEALGAWPFGVYVFREGILVHAGAPANCCVPLEPAREAVLSLLRGVA